jgi:hypothetical protein
MFNHHSRPPLTLLFSPYAISVTLSLTECEFEYSDAEHTPEPLRSQLKGYNAILYVYRPGVGLGLAVLPVSEWLHL